MTRVVQIDPGPMPTFTASAPAATRSRAPSRVATLPATTSMSQRRFIFAHRLDHVGRMAVRAVDDEEIDVLADQAAGPLEIKHTDRRPHPQPTLPVFGCLREAAHHVDVFDRDESGQSVIFVNQQKLLDLFCHQNLLSLLKRYGPLCCHQLVRGHHFADGNVVVLEKPQVAAGDDAHQLAVLHDRNAADLRAAASSRAR